MTLHSCLRRKAHWSAKSSQTSVDRIFGSTIAALRKMQGHVWGAEKLYHPKGQFIVSTIGQEEGGAKCNLDVGIFDHSIGYFERP